MQWRTPTSCATAPRTRTTGASLAYQLSAVVAGFSPLAATALYAWVGWIGPALMLTGYGLLGLFAALITRETWGPAERTAVDAVEHDATTRAASPEPQRATPPVTVTSPAPANSSL